MVGMVRQLLWRLWNYLLLYAVGAWYLVKELVTAHRTPTGISGQHGRVALVTGGGRGIGLETVRQFLQQDMTVVLAGRNIRMMEEAVERLRAKGLTQGSTVCLDLDLASLSSVRHCATQFLALNLPLHVLVNNAGIMFWPYERSKDGLELHWQVNYLGHFLLTHLLLPTLAASATPQHPARVVSLSSAVHYVGKINFEDVNSRTGYSAQAAYAQSKLAQMMFTLSLSEHVEARGLPVVVTAVHPGVVASELFQHVAWTTLFPALAAALLKSTQQGADTVVHAALSAQAGHTGQYYENCTVTQPATAALNSQDRARLWALSCHALNLDTFAQPQL